MLPDQCEIIGRDSPVLIDIPAQLAGLETEAVEVQEEAVIALKDEAVSRQSKGTG